MSEDANKSAEIFSSLELDTIGEIMNISMGSAATAASTLLDNKVTITTPKVEVISIEEFEINHLQPAVAVQIKYVEGITGSNILMLRAEDVRKILAQMMQTEIPDDYVIDEMAESAMCELMNQMMGSSATVLSCFLGRTINISTPIMLDVGDIGDFKREHFSNSSHIMTIKFNINITDIMDSEFVSVMEIELAKEIIAVSLNFDNDVPEEPQSSPASSANVNEPPAPPAYSLNDSPPPMQPPPGGAPMAPQYQQMPQQDPYSQNQYAPPQQLYPPQQPYPPQQQQYPPPQYAQQGYPPPNYPPQYQQQQNMHMVPTDPVMVRDYQFGDFETGGNISEVPANIDLVMNVPVVVTVELGRTKRKIKEILEFGQGTIVMLDKQAGSQVDVIVNGQLVAKGDVVVVDDNFSIRITEILKSRDSLTML